MIYIVYYGVVQFIPVANVERWSWDVSLVPSTTSTCTSSMMWMLMLMLVVCCVVVVGLKFEFSALRPLFWVETSVGLACYVR